LTILIHCYHTLTISLTYLKTSDQAACGFALPSLGNRLSLLLECREAWTRHGSSRMQAWGPNSAIICFWASSASRASGWVVSLLLRDLYVPVK